MKKKRTRTRTTFEVRHVSAGGIPYILHVITREKVRIKIIYLILALHPRSASPANPSYRWSSVDVPSMQSLKYSKRLSYANVKKHSILTHVSFPTHSVQE
jgi:hypothetical protein